MNSILQVGRGELGERALKAEGAVSTKAQGPEPEKGGKAFTGGNFFGLRTEKGRCMGNILNISCISPF